MELSRVRLMGVSVATGARHRNVDRIKYRDGRVHQASHEEAIAALTCAIVSRRDHVGADRSEQTDTPAHCGVPIAAIAANPGCLGRRLIKYSGIRLISAGCRV